MALKYLTLNAGEPEERELYVIGYDDLVCDTGAAASGTAAPTIITFNGHRIEQWAINDSKTFKAHIKHEYAAGTAMWPHVHWSVKSTNPNTTHRVQFDITISIGKAYAAAAFTTNRTISVVDTPTMYNANEIIQCSDAQSILASEGLEIDALIYLTVTRVTPATGTSYTGTVTLDYVDLHMVSDRRLTTTALAPFTKTE